MMFIILIRFKGVRISELSDGGYSSANLNGVYRRSASKKYVRFASCSLLMAILGKRSDCGFCQPLTARAINFSSGCWKASISKGVLPGTVASRSFLTRSKSIPPA